MLYGKQKINEKWYYFDTFNGRMQTGWYDLPTKTVYYAETGEMLYGDQQIDGEWYYFNEVTGALENSRTGWGEKDGQKVYYLQNGQMAIGEQQIGDKWYYFDESGYMQTGFVQHGSRTVYYAEAGEMLYGWHQIQGMWYYFHTFNGAQKYQTKELYDIEGSASVTVDQMVQFYLKNSPIDYPSDALSKGGANTLKAFCQTLKLL